jgi:hypothetical protein
MIKKKVLTQRSLVMVDQINLPPCTKRTKLMILAYNFVYTQFILMPQVKVEEIIAKTIIKANVLARKIHRIPFLFVVISWHHYYTVKNIFFRN